jgi:hypothetical protein
MLFTSPMVRVLLFRSMHFGDGEAQLRLHRECFAADEERTKATDMRPPGEIEEGNG